MPSCQFPSLLPCGAGVDESEDESEDEAPDELEDESEDEAPVESPAAAARDKQRQFNKDPTTKLGTLTTSFRWPGTWCLVAV